MGMAASQARLLCITARLHDVEYQAQSIQNAKIQLATQEDQAYREYNEALAATTLTVTSMDIESGKKSTVPATFNNLCSRNRLHVADGKTYALLNNKGKLIVEEEIENAYNENTFEDAYHFAMYMIDGSTDPDFTNRLMNAEEESFNNLDNKTLNKLHEKILNLLVEMIPNGTADDVAGIYDINIIENYATPEQKDEYENLLNQYKTKLYQADAANIMANATENPECADDFDYELFNYYIDIYNQIEAANGCVSIDDYNGDAANDSEWLQAMVQSGQFTIEEIKRDKETSEIDFNTASVSSESSIAYTPTTQIDNRALAKAEAAYEHKLKQIDKKDKMFDLDLSKLETERTALTTEYESVKKVIEDNIDRTFGIFS